MTNRQLITSGLLEAHLLGFTSGEEQVTVGQRIIASPELTAHVYALEADLGHHFLNRSVPPPPALRAVLDLRTQEQGLHKKRRYQYTDFGQPSAHTDTTAKPNYIDVEVDNTHIRVHKYWRPAFIAVFILSKIFLATGLYFYFKADSQAQEISRLKAEMHQTTPK